MTRSSQTFQVGKKTYKVGDKIGEWTAIKVEKVRGQHYETDDVVTFKKGDVEKTIYGTDYETEDRIKRKLNTGSYDGGKRTRRTHKRRTHKRRTHKRRTHKRRN